MEKITDNTTRPPTAWEIAKREGIDMSLIECALTKTPAQRIREHSHALATAIALRKAMEKANAGS